MEPLAAAKLCPHLGLLDDPSTQALTADSRHACHRVTPPALLPLQRQRSRCLGGEHGDCPGYSALAVPVSRPRMRAILPRRQALTGLALVALALLLVLAGTLPPLRAPQPAPAWIPPGAAGSLSAPAAQAGPPATPAGLALTAAAETPSPSLIATRTARPTRIPSATATAAPRQASPTPGPGLETPFGAGYLVHRVTPGESLEYLAGRYQTSLAALRALNALPEGGLWAEALVVIAPGHSHADGLPRLRAVWLEQGAALASLAERYASAPADLRAWNGLTGDWLPGGRWLLVSGQ